VFYDIFINLCAEKGKRPSDVSRELGIGKSTISMWKKQNSIPTAVTLMQLAEYFNVTPAYLAGNKLAKGPLHSEAEGEQKETPTLTKKDERDISKKMQETLAQLEEQQSGLMFDGEPLDDETKELLAISLKNSLELAKKIAKQKYTPKKYRKKSE
jgi:transcriptional regulator with XRE-family HTH domain